MKKNVTLVDYGICNIFNVQRALEFCGAEVVLTSDPGAIRDAEFLVLPGVGAFAAGMKGLQERGLENVIIDYAQTGRTLLGICLGMQMLFDESTEFGTHPGLGIIPGRIVPINPVSPSGNPLKVPHIGWNNLRLTGGEKGAEDDALKYVEPEARCYFVHSYTASPTHEENRLADALYGDFRISAMVKKAGVYGCQFHPEKSGPVGLSILRGLLERTPGSA